jgi:signal transduction histidine kinase
VSVGERKMVETERKKYMDFVRKNYNQTISEELTTVNKLRTKIKEHQNRDEAERRRAFDEKNGKNLA